MSPAPPRGRSARSNLESGRDPTTVGLDRNGLEILDRDQCLALLRSREFGRVGFVSYGLPAILPVSYRILGGNIVFATGTGSKSLSVARGQVIAFEVDDTAAGTRSGWSVVAVGKATELTERDADWESARHLELHPWVGHFADQLIRVPTGRLTGRRLRGPAAPRNAT